MTDVQTQPDATPIATDVVSANGNKAEGATGTILQITGPVVDVQFPADMLPEIYNALEVTRDDGSILTLETQSHLGNDAVRAIAMSTTDGLRRGVGDRTPPHRCDVRIRCNTRRAAGPLAVS